MAVLMSDFGENVTSPDQPNPSDLYIRHYI